MKKYLFCAALLATFLLIAAQSTIAVPVISFEWTEGGPGNGTNSGYTSFHNDTGPVLADDFTPDISGMVVQVDWWGSDLLSTEDPDLWAITFHDDADSEPAFTAPSGGISQHFVNSPGADDDGDGVFLYSAAWEPQDVTIVAGTDYWFSVANATGSGWEWANPGAGPTVGSEEYGAVYSEGEEPSIIDGPYDGPWHPLEQGGFAFRIWVESESVPEPSTLFLIGFGLIALVGLRKKEV